MKYLISILLLTACATPEQQNWHRVVTHEHYSSPHLFTGDLKPFLDSINAKWMAYPYKVDARWPTRAETAQMGQADCKGRAIGEYFDLLDAGVPTDDLRLEVIRIPSGYRHMILIAGDWVLGLRPAVRPASELKPLNYTVEYKLTARG